MNILHYTIGLPPKRNGGSVLYAYDLMRQQAAEGHDVYALICGDTLFRTSKSKIKNQGISDGLKVFELTNPLTPTMIYGVSNPDLQHRYIEIDNDNIKDFILSNSIEVFHLHTFQGLHRDVVALIRDLGVKIIYTTHDFHGICPKYNLIDFNGNLCAKVSAEKCAVCNVGQPSDMFLRIANSHLYQSIKKSGFLPKKKVKASLNINQTDNTTLSETYFPDKVSIRRYDDLLSYYKVYFSLVDRFHFNSSQTKAVFSSFIPSAKGEVIPVLTSGIKDRRRKLEVKEDVIFGFVGSTNDYKGFPLLKTVLMELKDEGYDNFRLKVYGADIIGIDNECSNIEYCRKYRYSEISDVLYALNCVIVPSKWYETFSLVTLEALAHGCPVVVSDHVGAKDIVVAYTPDFIFSNKDGLKNILKGILENPRELEKANSEILAGPWKFTLKDHTQKILDFYLS